MAPTVSHAALLAAFVATVSAHGRVEYLRTAGVVSQGYDPVFQYANPSPQTPGWVAPLTQDNGFVADPTTADIICHKSATPAPKSLTVKAGDTLDFLWTVWPASHKGPVMTYLAPCSGDCTTVDKTTLSFVKIDAVGLISGTTSTGTWASDKMIANNNTWTTTIPANIPSGQYVARHETIALHAAQAAGGAQYYPQCITINVTGGSGSSFPSGTLGTALYKESDPGVEIDIYNGGTSYTIPGPAQFGGASSGASSPAPPASSASAPASSASAPASSAPASKQPSPTTVVTSVKPSATVTKLSTSTTMTTTTGAGAAPSASAGGAGANKIALPSGTTSDELSTWISSVIKAYYASD